MKQSLVIFASLLITATASVPYPAHAVSFGDDLAFLKNHTDVIVLSDKTDEAKVVDSHATTRGSESQHHE